MLRGISISSTWFTCSGTILIRRATDAPLATLKSAVSFDFLNGCRFDFLSLSPGLLPAPIAPLSSSSSRWWSSAAACGVLRRRGTHRTAFEVFCPCDSASRQLGQLPRGGTPVQPRVLSPANLRIDSPPSRSAFQTVPGHPEADEAGCCVDIAGLGETGVDGQFQLRRGGRSPVQPCTPSPANVRTHSPPSRSTHQSIPGH